MPKSRSDHMISIHQELRRMKTRLENLEARDEFRIIYDTAFPASPFTNMFVFRTDIEFLAYYDGSQWLSANRYTINFGERDISAGINYRKRIVNHGYAIYLDPAQDVISTTYVAAPNDGSNHWTLTLTAETAGSASPVTLHTFNTSADTAAIFTAHDDVPDDNSPSSYDLAEVTITKTNSPGNLLFTLSFEYQLILT